MTKAKGIGATTEAVPILDDKFSLLRPLLTRIIDTHLSNMRTLKIKWDCDLFLNSHGIGFPDPHIGRYEPRAALRANVTGRVYPDFLELRKVLCHHDQLIAIGILKTLTSVQIKFITLGSRAARLVLHDKVLLRRGFREASLALRALRRLPDLVHTLLEMAPEAIFKVGEHLEIPVEPVVI